MFPKLDRWDVKFLQASYKKQLEMVYNAARNGGGFGEIMPLLYDIANS
jgi:hypothetical protein